MQDFLIYCLLFLVDFVLTCFTLSLYANNLYNLNLIIFKLSKQSQRLDGADPFQAFIEEQFHFVIQQRHKSANNFAKHHPM